MVVACKMLLYYLLLIKSNGLRPCHSLLTSIVLQDFTLNLPISENPKKQININMAQIVLNSTTLFPWISHDFMTFFVSLTTQSFVKVPSSKPISSVSRAVAGTPDGNMEHFGAKPRDHRFSKQILRFFEFILGQP